MRTVEFIKICNDMASLQLPPRYFEGDDAIQDETVQRLLFCANCVLEELFCDYATDVKTCTVQAENNFIDIARLHLNRVLSLTRNGVGVKYRYTTGGLVVENGTYLLTYAALPQPLEWNGNVELPSPRLTFRIFAYGVLAEYFLNLGDFALARVWEEKYHDALHAASVKRSSMNLPAGRWI